MKKNLFTILATFLAVNASFAQLAVTDSLSNTDIQNLLTGFGVNISNLNVNCAPSAMGEFSGVSEIPISNGLILTTGFADNLIGPNNSTSATGNSFTPGDSDLDSMITSVTYDGCAVEFDCVPQGDTLLFNFAFGSEEYPEFVGSFNDAFAILLSGPGFSNAFNAAQLPNGDVVSINNVNAFTNSSYYFANDSGIFTQYDGFTQNLEVFALTNPGSTYHVKVVIADNLDQAFDSGVMLEAFSFRSPVSVTGLNKNNASYFKLYPNPAQTQIFVSSGVSSSQSAEITIYNMAGVMVLKQQLTAPLHSINSSELPAGIYTVEYRSGSNTERQKLIINK